MSAGRLVPQKDFATLLKAFAEVRAKLDSRLVLLGEGEERSSLERMARQLGIGGDVWMPGYVPNPYAMMSRAAVFVLSSVWEGLPTVLIEALACGTPVVSTDCPNGPAEILENGRYGPLVPVGDHSALGRAIISSLETSTDRDKLTRRAQDFSVGRALEQYLGLIRWS